jgi:hypothetical protein
MRYLRLLAMFVLSVTTGLGGAEAATSGPPLDVAATAAGPGQPEPAPIPAALGSPCFGSIAMADRQETSFSLDLFSMGPMGYAPAGPPVEDNGVLGLLCRITDFPLDLN